jgi:translation initiation factor IF-3
VKITVYADRDNAFLALRTAMRLADQPDQNDIILSFENGESFLAKRNKVGITVWQDGHIGTSQNAQKRERAA